MKNQKVPKRYNILNPYKVEKFLILFSKFNSFLKWNFLFSKKFTFRKINSLKINKSMDFPSFGKKPQVQN